MAFKLRGWSAGAGTGSAGMGTGSVDPRLREQSALTKSPMKADPWSKAVKQDPNLTNLVKARNAAKAKHGKDSTEYATAQNRVNVAYQDAKTHGVKKETIVDKDRKKVTVKTIPGVATIKTKTKKDESGTITKQKDTYKDDPYYGGGKVKAKFKDKEGVSAETGTETGKKKVRKSKKKVKYLDKVDPEGAGKKRKFLGGEKAKYKAKRAKKLTEKALTATGKKKERIEKRLKKVTGKK